MVRNIKSKYIERYIYSSNNIHDTSYKGVWNQREKANHGVEGEWMAILEFSSRIWSWGANMLNNSKENMFHVAKKIK